MPFIAHCSFRFDEMKNEYFNILMSLSFVGPDRNDGGYRTTRHLRPEGKFSTHTIF